MEKRRRGGDGGVIDQEMRRAVSVADFGSNPFDLGKGADIRDVSSDGLGVRAEFFRCGREGGRIAVDQREAALSNGKLAGDGAAEAVGGSGDDGDPAGELAEHGGMDPGGAAPGRMLSIL